MKSTANLTSGFQPDRVCRLPKTRLPKKPLNFIQFNNLQAAAWIDDEEAFKSNGLSEWEVVLNRLNQKRAQQAQMAQAQAAQNQGQAPRKQ